MTTILIIIGTIILVYAMLFIMAPTKYEIIRSVIVDKPIPEVFSHIRSLKLQDYWSPWGNDVDDKAFIFSGTDGQVGSKNAWTLKYKFFELEGEHEIIRLVEDRFIETEIRYTKPFKVTSLAYMNVYEEGTKTIIYWGFRGKYKRPLNIVIFFIGLDKYFGRRFEVALKKIKHYIEFDVTTFQQLKS